ncbi:MAG: 3-dehydroquinate synthase [Pyrinomonadaceae bacterium]|nr:3-dehydroquinate synthase [Pyrinomonadaceae bacterium]
MQRLSVRLAAAKDRYEIKIGRGILAELGDEIRSCLPHRARRVALISNQKVFSLYGAQTLESIRAAGYEIWPFLIGDGERYKTLVTLRKIILFLSEAGLERTDAVVALGGGVIGDVAGFAAATYLRGVPFFQVPTTLIAQIDSSVGGKTGVNLPHGKNLVGAFHQPCGVLVDTETLTTLAHRELVSGWCESIKQGAVGSRALFKQTRDYLKTIKSDPGALVSPALENLIRSQCGFKAAIVTGDEREAPERTDHLSRRVLNFGHTVGHALESITKYRRFRHGEAVGYGMLVAGQMSKDLGLLATSELELLRDTVRLAGSLPAASDLDERAIMRSILRDKKSVDGRIKWVLLQRIGRARIVDGKEISPRLLRGSITDGLKQNF